MEQELYTVVACVDAVSSSYLDGVRLVGNIQAKKKAARLPIDPTAQELQQSLQQGESSVRTQYDRCFRRFGNSMAMGDQIARDAMKDILIHLQQQVIANLEIHRAHETFLDFAALQDVSDSCQDRCVLILMQLQQRIITSGPIENVTPPPLSAIGMASGIPGVPTNRALLDPQYARSSLAKITASNATSPELPESVFLAPGKPRSPLPLNRPLTPPLSPSPPVGYPNYREGPQGSPTGDVRVPSQQHNLDNRAGSSLSQRRPSLNGRDSSQSQYKPLATTVTTGGIFGFGKRTKVEPVVEPPENPLVDEYLAAANIVDEYSGMDRQSSVSTTNKTVSLVGSSILEPNPPNVNPWPVYSPRQQIPRHLPNQFSPSQRPSPSPSDRSTRSQDTRGSQDTRRSHNTRSSQDTRGSYDTMTHFPTSRRPNMEVLMSNRAINAINPKDLLPSEVNKFGGFCKGAWRQQIGDKKKAMEERTRPGGMYNAAKYWQCKSCKFEGRLVVIDKKHSRFDMRVFKLVDGIQFRWEFMFKSHIVQKEALPDPTKSTFGCIFCCAEGKGTPIFQGVQAFMQHLIQHRDPLPTGEILYRMNCLVGRQATVDEDFDINIISAEGGFL